MAITPPFTDPLSLDKVGKFIYHLVYFIFKLFK